MNEFKSGEISKLKKLLATGILTKEEFDSQIKSVIESSENEHSINNQITELPDIQPQLKKSLIDSQENKKVIKNVLIDDAECKLNMNDESVNKQSGKLQNTELKFVESCSRKDDKYTEIESLDHLKNDVKKPINEKEGIKSNNKYSYAEMLFRIIEFIVKILLSLFFFLIVVTTIMTGEINKKPLVAFFSTILFIIVTPGIWEQVRFFRQMDKYKGAIGVLLFILLMLAVVI